MSDGLSNSPEGFEQEVNPGRITLYKSSRFQVFVPEKPNIPLNEGLHVQVSSGNDEFESPKQVLKRYLISEGVAKILAESGQTRDAWANTRIEKGQTVSIYGRIPGEENSWRKPVDTFDKIAPFINRLEPFYDTQKLQELFENGVNGADVDSSSGEEIPVWQNDKFTLVVVSTPHVKGIHLVVHPKESFKRQWQTVRESPDDIKNSKMVQRYVQSTLEATAIAMGAQEILGERRGEIHNSGNWAPDLKTTTDEGGSLIYKIFRGKGKRRKNLIDQISQDLSNKLTQVCMHIFIFRNQKA